MKMRVMLMVAMLALSGAAFADSKPKGDHNDDGHSDNGNSTVQTNPNSNGNGGNGGQGGNGGNGGNAYGAGGQGGDAIQGQLQGQLQGQAQGQLQGQAQSATSVALAGAAAGAAVVGSGNSGPVNSTNTNSATGGNATGGNASATGGNATNAGNTQTVNFNEAANKTVRNVGTVEVRSVPTAIAPNVYPTASCAMSASVGASALGWGVSGGGTKVNEECMMLEGARMFSQLGYPIQGIILACSTKSAIAVFGSAQKCVDASAPVTAPVAVAPQPVAMAQPVKVETTIPFASAN